MDLTQDNNECNHEKNRRKYHGLIKHPDIHKKLITTSIEIKLLHSYHDLFISGNDENRAITQLFETEKETNLVITIYKLLFAQANKFSCGKEISTFKGTGCTETPAGSASSLIQYTCS